MRHQTQDLCIVNMYILIAHITNIVHLGQVHVSLLRVINGYLCIIVFKVQSPYTWILGLYTQQQALLMWGSWQNLIDHTWNHPMQLTEYNNRKLEHTKAKYGAHVFTDTHSLVTLKVSQWPLYHSTVACTGNNKRQCTFPVVHWQKNTMQFVTTYVPTKVDNGLGKEQGKAAFISNYTLTHKHSALIHNSPAEVENRLGRE